jgi:hypothetical protein
VLDSGDRCPEMATDVDHVGDRFDHSPANLRSLCGWHHRQRTSTQGALAKAAREAKLRHP